MKCEPLRLPRSKPGRIALEPKRGARTVWAWNLAGEARTTGLAMAMLLVAGRRQCRCDFRAGEDVSDVVFGVPA